MDPNKLQSDVVKRIRILADGNMGAGSVITGTGDALPAVLDQLEKFNIRGCDIWCLFKDHCNADQDMTTEFIINMKERPTGYCINEHDWGPSRSAKRTQCFAPECKEEATKYCSRCYSTRYCSKKCQADGWKDGHNKRCKQNVVNIEEAIKKMGVSEASSRLYILGLLSKQAVIQYMKKRQHE